MLITVAGVKKEFTEGLTVSELITLENVENPEYVTVTINDDFVKSAEITTTVLNENDNVEFLYFMGGGSR
jgi:sulfur carrier protein